MTLKLFAAGFLLCIPSFCLAQQPVPPKPAEGAIIGQCPVSVFETCECQPSCEVRILPYGWLPGVHGDLTVHGVTAPVDVSIGKTWDIFTHDLEFAAIGQVEATCGNWGALANGVYADVSPGARIRNLTFDGDLSLAIIDLAVTYQCDGLGAAICLPQGARIEVLAGVRYNLLSAGITVTGPRGNSATADGTRDWWDPIIGIRVRYPVNECLTLQVRGDVGGFHIGNASHFTWNIEATAEYRTSDRCSIFAGWRWLDIDYTHGSGNREFAYDVLLSGPMLGLAVRF
jgi:hypothetical protein